MQAGGGLWCSWMSCPGFRTIWQVPISTGRIWQGEPSSFWRQGQADKTVIIQHIVAKDTIDERILNVLKHKDGTQAALIDAVKADLGMTETGNGGIL